MRQLRIAAILSPQAQEWIIVLLRLLLRHWIVHVHHWMKPSIEGRLTVDTPNE